MRGVAPRTELGRTRLYTRRERRRRLAAILLGLMGAVLAAWVAAAVVSWLSAGAVLWPSVHLRPVLTGDGNGGLLGLPHGEAPTNVPARRRPQIPITLTWPEPVGWTTVAAVPLWLGWLRLAVWPLLVGLRQPARQRGLASIRAIRAELGARRVRRRGRYTLPTTSRWIRLVLPMRAFGYRLGRPLRERRMWLWADWEQRIRIVARTGWGKTDRLLVPIIRALPGAALVASIEPGIFDKTVTARQFRRPALRWRWLTRLARPWLRLVEYPVAVVDFSAPQRRFAAGYPAVRWSPILGCADYAIAYRRALALVTGADRGTPQQSVGGGENSQFFRDSASEVLAAWLHAADLAALDIDDVLGWLRQPDDPAPTRILRDERRAEPSAAVNLGRHLDPAAARTTSGVLRYLTLALNSLATSEGRALCGRRRDTQFDMPAHVAAGGTVYLLADTSRIERTRPLLSLFAGELFMAAEAVALTSVRRRLPQPFIGVIDEVRYGIPVPNLPYVASAQRKYNIGYVYGVQTASQEDTVYGPDAAALRAAAGVSIIGGIDVDSARELSDRAGPTPVVTSTRGADVHNEYIQVQDTLTIADQQRLADGQAVVIARGLAPFLAWVPSYRDTRALARAIDRDADTVTQRVARAQRRAGAHQHNHTAAIDVGADIAAPGEPS
jgi:hypothetical protein